VVLPGNVQAVGIAVAGTRLTRYRTTRPSGTLADNLLPRVPVSKSKKTPLIYQLQALPAVIVLGAMWCGTSKTRAAFTCSLFVLTAVFLVQSRTR
jgi:hypothetical protein